MDPSQLPPSTLEKLERAERLKLEGKNAEALAILEQILLEDPGNVAALEEVADNELSCNRYDRAENAARQAIALDRGSYTGHYILGFIRSHFAQWEEARTHLIEANRLHPNNPEILRCLGWVLVRLLERPQGLVTLERALNLDRDNPLTLCDLGVTYMELRNLSKARSLFQRSLDIDPQSDRARECLAMTDRLEAAMKAER